MPVNLSGGNTLHWGSGRGLLWLASVEICIYKIVNDSGMQNSHNIPPTSKIWSFLLSLFSLPSDPSHHLWFILWELWRFINLCTYLFTYLYIYMYIVKLFIIHGYIIMKCKNRYFWQKKLLYDISCFFSTRDIGARWCCFQLSVSVWSFCCFSDLTRLPYSYHERTCIW